MKYDRKVEMARDYINDMLKEGVTGVVLKKLYLDIFDRYALGQTFVNKYLKLLADNKRVVLDEDRVILAQYASHQASKSEELPDAKD